MATKELLEADARPTKGFFVQNLTRDLSLEDAILDLVDNSIDAFIRTRKVDISAGLLQQHGQHVPPIVIRVFLSPGEFRIEDTCGGMDLDHARHQVFRFGRPDGSYQNSLGVYGIGLKRALFKIGRMIEVRSRTTESGFSVSINVDSWVKDEKTWGFPLQAAPAASDLAGSGSTITVHELTSETTLRLQDGTLLSRLESFIASTYALFLAKHIGIELNGVRITPRPLPLAATDLLSPNSRLVTLDEVSVSLVAGLQERQEAEWSAERAGWYVLCNGRVVVIADKSDLTGWGIGGPTFVSKHRGFLGIAFFFSGDPAALPWTTTKRGLNRDSPVYQVVRKEMAVLARPVLSFLNSFYPSEAAEKRPARDVVAGLKPANMGQVVATQHLNFPTTVPRLRGGRSSVRVQFDAPRSDVERVRQRIGKPSWSAGAVGRFTFEHYLRTELPE